MKGKVWKFGDNIDTDLILPGRYLIYSDKDKLARHCMGGIDEEFYQKCNAGDFIVAGTNFGCGSSREHAPIAIKSAGIKCVIAESFARIFYRNAINVGLMIIEAPGIKDFVDNNDEITINLDKSLIIANTCEIAFKKLPDFMMEILQNGGLIEYLKK